MSARTLSVLLILSIPIIGCTMQPYAGARYSGLLPAGSRVEVIQPLPLRTGHSRVFLQHGQVVKKHHLDRFAPHCNFEIAHLAHPDLRIEPGLFLIRRVIQGDAQVVQWRGLQLAMRVMTGWIWHGEDGPPMITRYIRYQLDAVSPADPIRLTCYGAEADAPDARLPTLHEIASALGDKARILD